MKSLSSKEFFCSPLLLTIAIMLTSNMLFLTGMEDPKKHQSNAKISARASAALELLMAIPVAGNSIILDGDAEQESLREEYAHYYPNSVSKKTHISPPSAPFFTRIKQLFIPAPVPEPSKRVIVSVSRFMASSDKSSLLNEYWSRIHTGEILVIGLLGPFDRDHHLLRALDKMKIDHQRSEASRLHKVITAYGHQNYKILELFEKICWKTYSLTQQLRENTYHSQQEFYEWLNEWIDIMPFRLSESCNKKAFCKEFVEHYAKLSGQSENTITFSFHQMIICAEKR